MRAAAALAAGVAALLVGCTAAPDATEIGSSATDSPTPDTTTLTYEETFDAFEDYWVESGIANRVDFCRNYATDPDGFWQRQVESNPGVFLVRAAFEEVVASHCTEEGKPREESASPTEEEATTEPSVYESFGVFESVKKSGSGDSVVKLGDATDATAVAVAATHKGSSNFAVKSLDADNEQIDLLVNEIGNYSGTTYLEVEDATRLQISADGAWKIRVRPIADVREVDAPFKGTGDRVLLYSGGATDWTIKHTGESNFAVWQHATSGSDLLVNEIGNYSGTIPATSGPSILVITADGPWTFK